MTEKPGAWTLELRDPAGKLIRQLTQPEPGLRDLVGVDSHGAIVEASTVPTLQDIWRIPFDGGTPAARIGTGVASARLANTARLSSRRCAQPAAGAPSRSATPRGTSCRAWRSSRAWSRPRCSTVELGGRVHDVAITRPRAFDASRRYPVLLKVYAGPHRNYVDAAREGYVMDQYMAGRRLHRRRADGRGTPNHGRAWERAILEDLITVPLADQVDALHALGARHHELDMARVGISGWSFGGYVAAMAALLHPRGLQGRGRRRAGHRLGALRHGVHRALHADARGEPRRLCGDYSAITHAAKLTWPLLIIHGITDDNVHFAHTLALVEVLYVAGKRAEVITLSATHCWSPDPKLNSRKREQVQVEFFREHLGSP